MKEPTTVTSPFPTAPPCLLLPSKTRTTTMQNQKILKSSLPLVYCRCFLIPSSQTRQKVRNTQTGRPKHVSSNVAATKLLPSRLITRTVIWKIQTMTPHTYDQSSIECEDDWVAEWEDSDDNSSSDDSMPILLDRRLRSTSTKNNLFGKKPAVISVVSVQQTAFALDKLPVANLADNGLLNHNPAPPPYATTALWGLPWCSVGKLWSAWQHGGDMVATTSR
jgi:hypothetical protein